MPRLASTAAIIVTALAVSACGGAAHRLDRRPAARPLLSIMQEDSLALYDPGPLLDAAHALGVQMIRANVFWRAVAPGPTSTIAPAGFDGADPAAYPPAGWTGYDRLVRDAARLGLRIDFTVTGPGPLWAVGSRMPHTRNCPCGQWKPNPRLFGAFVHALGVRYSGHYVPPGATVPLPRVAFWSIWNEPNYGPNLAPQAVDGSRVEVSPGLYRRLLRAAWEALIQSGHTTATDTILIGETAPRGRTGPHLPGDFSGMVPLRFIRALYCVDASFRWLRGAAAAERGCPTDATARSRWVAENPALFHASGWADHPYPDALAPTVRTPPPFGGGYADFAALGNLFTTLDRAAAAWRSPTRLPVYSTEFGYRTNPPTQLGVPLAQAGAWLNEAEYLSWRDPRIRSYDQYLLADPPPSSGSDFVTGLEFADGAEKPSVLAAFRMPLWLPVTHASRGSSLEVWGCVRPAPQAASRSGHSQFVAIQFSRPGGSFRTLRRIRIPAGGNCYFDADVSFPASGTVRLAWRAGPRLLVSRAQAITLR